MANLRTVLDSLTLEGDGLATDAPDGWTQGRTLYGGLTAALSVQAALLKHADLPPPRSGLFTFAGPASGRLTFTPTLLRQGRAAAVVSVDAVGDSGFAARSVLTFGAARESQVAHDHRLGVTPARPAACEAFFLDGQPGRSFFQNFEMRIAGGGRPLSGDIDDGVGFDVWVRHLDDAGVDPAISLLALADSLPPAAMVVFPNPAPISTMTWMVDFAQPVAAGTWRYVRSYSEAAADGYSHQAMEVYDDEGRRIAVGRQTMAIFV
mgnify:CR=1 FL=1